MLKLLCLFKLVVGWVVGSGISINESSKLFDLIINCLAFHSFFRHDFSTALYRIDRPDNVHKTKTWVLRRCLTLFQLEKDWGFGMSSRFLVFCVCELVIASSETAALYPQSTAQCGAMSYLYPLICVVTV